MATTTRFALRYSGLNEAANAEQLGQFLALDVEGWLSRAFPCLSSARPTGVGAGFLIYETDTGLVQIWSGSAWAPVGGGGGGGAFAGVKGEWKAAANQSIPDSVDTAVLFGTTVVSSAIVTRNAFGAGSSFTIGQDGTYAIAATIRFGAGPAGGNRFVELRNTANTARWVSSGNDGGPGAVTLPLSVVDRFTAGTVLYVCAAQFSGGALALDRDSDSPAMEGFVSIRITKIAA